MSYCWYLYVRYVIPLVEEDKIHGVICMLYVCMLPYPISAPMSDVSNGSYPAFLKTLTNTLFMTAITKHQVLTDKLIASVVLLLVKLSHFMELKLRSRKLNQSLNQWWWHGGISGLLTLMLFSQVKSTPLEREEMKFSPELGLSLARTANRPVDFSVTSFPHYAM